MFEIKGSEVKTAIEDVEGQAAEPRSGGLQNLKNKHYAIDFR